MSQAQRIGQFIRAYREKLNLTQEALANRADLPVDSIRKYEGGRRAEFLQPYTAEKLADALELAPGSPERATFFEITRAKAPRGGRRKEPRNRLLDQVQEFWIDGVLEQSLQGSALIPLRMELFRHRGAQPVQQPVDPSGAAPESSSAGLIREVFASVSNTLLILGQAGSGKTVVLLDLAQHLIERAAEDVASPIPVVLPLASWAEDQLVLERWIEDELARMHFLARGICRQLLAAGLLVPLLDGLDEVRPDCREACVAAINTFGRSYPGQLVVCCRSSAYAALMTRLDADVDVTLQPLDNAQIDLALRRSGRRLAAVRELLQPAAIGQASGEVPPGATLRELAASPLMLSIIIQSYDEVGRDELAIYGSLEAQRRHLLDVYTTRMLAPRDYSTYPAYQTRAALGWLAQQLQRHDQTLFFLDQLQPAWLSSSTARRVYYIADRIGSGLIAGLVLSGSYAATLVTYGLARSMGDVYWQGFLPDVVLIWLIGAILGGLYGGHQERWRSEPNTFWLQVRDRVLGWVCGGLLMGIAVLLVTGDMAEALMCSLIGALAGLMMQRPMLKTRPVILVEERSWSWAHTLKLLPAYLSAGLVVGLVIGLFIRQVDGVLGRLLPPLVGSVAAGLVTGLLASVIFGVTYSDNDTRVIPNQGVWRSVRNAVRSAMEGAIGGALFGAMVMSGPVSWIVTALIGGLLGALASGAITALSHFTLRLVIAQYTPFPLRAVRFLEHGVERGLLQRVGGGYQFLHPLLRDYLARDAGAGSSETRQRTIHGIGRPGVTLSLWYEVAGFVLFFLLLGLGGAILHRSEAPDVTIANPTLIIDAAMEGYTGQAVAAVDIRHNAMVAVTVTGRMSIGAFSQNLSPAGSERGGLGLPLGDMFKRERRFPAGALLCRVTGEAEWRLCGEHLTFVSPHDGRLEFLVNNSTPEKHQGRYLITIDT